MQPEAKEDIDYEVEAALASHDDDAQATIATLLADIRHLRLHLALTDSAVSRGMVRGWSPKYDR